MFIAALFIKAKCWEQPKCPSINKKIKKLWYTMEFTQCTMHLYTLEYYAGERKKEILPFATKWMELDSIMISEISQVVTNAI